MPREGSFGLVVGSSAGKMCIAILELHFMNYLKNCIPSTCAFFLGRGSTPMNLYFQI